MGPRLRKLLSVLLWGMLLLLFVLIPIVAIYGLTHPGPHPIAALAGRPVSYEIAVWDFGLVFTRWDESVRKPSEPAQVSREIVGVRVTTAYSPYYSVQKLWIDLPVPYLLCCAVLFLKVLLRVKRSKCS